MKKIKDYLDKDIAIKCNTQEEWDNIVKLICQYKGSCNTTSKFNKINKNHLYLRDINICGNNIGTGTKLTYVNSTIYPASDFLSNTHPFEVGKWYKYNNYIGKFAGEKDGLFTVSEYIHNNKFNDVKDYHNKWGKIDDYQKILLEDLSEIQEWLPDGHVDKIKIEIIPEYVECIKGTNTDNYNNLGKIYKVEYYNSYTGEIKILGKTISSIFFGEKSLVDSNRTDYKPSTKEAYEAQNKSKQLTVGDLIEGEIYFCKNSNFGNGNSGYIFLKIGSNSIKHIAIGNKDYSQTGWNFWTDASSFDLRQATPEEKKWLNICIKWNKFIPKEDLHLYDDSGLLIWEIGCYYKLNFTDNTSTYIKLSKKTDDKIFGNEYTDSTGKWYYNEINWFTKQLKSHEKVDKPNQKEETMFRKNDYIVIIEDSSTSNCWKNFIIKQLKNYNSIAPIITPSGKNNSDCSQSYSNFTEKNKVWRYATSEEIAEYDRLGKPFDVTTLVKKIEKPADEILKANVMKNIDFEIGDIVDYNGKKSIILGFSKDLESCVIEFEDISSGQKGHDGNDLKYWYDKNGYQIQYAYKSQGRYYVSITNLIKPQLTSYSVGRYLKALIDHPNAGIVGKGEYGLITDILIINEKVKADFPSQKSYVCSNLKDKYELMPEGWKPKQPINEKELLIEEARKRYPIGTKFKCAEGGTECIVTEEQYEGFRYGYIAKDSIDAQGMYYVYYKGKWAEIIKVESNMKEIQEECMRMFPIGCKYISAGSSNYPRILEKDTFTYTIKNNHVYTHEGGGVLFKGDTQQYAELISLPEEEEKGWIPQVGDWVVLISGDGKPNWSNDMKTYVGKCVKLIDKQNYFYIQEDNKNWSWEYSERTKHFRKALPHEISSNKINEYGLYVGYKLDANIITKWAKNINNYLYDGGWKKISGKFIGDRIIEKIDFKDGKPAFLVSGTMNIWLKAEGFREFDAHESLQEKEGFEGKKDFVDLSNKGIEVQIYRPGDKKTITTNINTVTSIQEQLIKPKQTILF